MVVGLRSPLQSCVRVRALTAEVGLQASFAHEFSHDVNGLSSGAHRQQLDQLRVMEALQRLDLLYKLVLLRVLWRTRRHEVIDIHTVMADEH